MLRWFSTRFRNTEEEREKILSSKRNEKIPINDVGCMSYLLLNWMTSLVYKIIRNGDQSLKEDLVWNCSDFESAEHNAARLSVEWTKELADKGPDKASFMRVWLRFIRTRLIILVVATCLFALVGFFVTGFLMEMLIRYLSTTTDTVYYGLMLVVFMGFGQILRAVLFVFIYVFGAHTGIRIRSGVLGLAFQKLLKLKTLKGNEIAEVLTIFGSDSLRIHMNCTTAVFIIAVPVYLIISGGFLCRLIGIWCLVPTAIYLVFFYIQIYLTSKVSSLRRKGLIFTDKRIRLIAEIIRNMKLIKMYAWEEPFKCHLKKIRKQERWYLLLTSIVHNLTSSIIPLSPTVVSVITIVCIRYVGYSLDASLVFGMIATFNYMRFIIAYMPLVARNIGEVRVSFERVKKLLLREEFVAPNSECFKSLNAVEIDNGIFSDVKNINGKRQQHTLLHNIYMEVEKEKLIGVCGPVGCGKSSLLAAILGRIPKLSGHLAVSGSVAYAAQQAWIFNGTVRENITFGKSFDLTWYVEVIYACGLEPDLAMFPDGDKTEIGERGVNLSGGQKQRVSLARAVYSKSDIYLLDDPLSAVDIHVGKHIFDVCIRQTLKNKTVILTTHQMQYLHQCNEIIVMKKGTITQKGNHEVLISGRGYYRSMMNQFHSIAKSALPKEGDMEQNPGQTNKPPQSSVMQIMKNNQKDVMKDRQFHNVALSHKTNTATLIAKEETDSGSVSWTVYKSYISAAGGVWVAIIVLLSSMLSQASWAFNTTWLALWISNTKENDGNVSEEMVNQLNFSAAHNDEIKGIVIFMSNNTPKFFVTQDDSIWDTFLIIFVASLGAVIFFSITRSFIYAYTFLRASSTLHNKMLEKVMKVPMYFFDSNPNGRILNRFSRDLDEGDVYIPVFLESLLSVFCLIVTSMFVALATLPWIGIVVVPVCCLLYWMKTVFFVPVLQLKRFENVARSPLLSYVQTTGDGLTTLVTLKQEPQFHRKCMKLADVTSCALLLYECSMRWICLRLDFVTSIVVITAFLVMVLTRGTIDPSISALSLTMCLASMPLIQLHFRTINEVEARFTSIERIHEYEKNLQTEETSICLLPEKNWPRDGHLLVSDIEMKYQEHLPPVLKHFGFEILSGQKIGIVGRTGAGKSSLVAALFRLVELSKGHIYIDGVDISQVPLRYLRSHLSTIPQYPVLFEGSIRYNLDPFSALPDSKIWSALEKARLKNKIKQLKGMLHHFVEENGGNFSVGERQLLCLARAILKQNKILILDEATASIDTSTDAMIQQTIRESFADCTVLTIAHRLNTILHCDKVIVIDAGQVVEVGSPHDLRTNSNSFFNSLAFDQS